MDSVSGCGCAADNAAALVEELEESPCPVSGVAVECKSCVAAAPFEREVGSDPLSAKVICAKPVETPHKDVTEKVSESVLHAPAAPQSSAAGGAAAIELDPPDSRIFGADVSSVVGVES